MWKPLFNLMGEVEPSQVSNRAAAILARTGQADLALIALPPKPDGKIEIVGGYDGRNKRYLPVSKIESSSMPVLISCFKMGRVRRLAAESTAPDIACISKLFGLEQVGNILLMPVLQPDGKPLAGVVLVAPDAQKDWSPKEQSTISLLSKLLVQFLQRMQETASLKIELDQARQSNRATQEQAQQTLEEKLKLRDQVTVLQESARRDQEQIMSMAALVANQTSLQATLEQMKAENEQLKENIRQAIEEAVAREKPLGGELRLALEEIALLRNAVAEAESEIANLEVNPVDASPSSEQLATIQSIGQDLRQPLSSIVGYTDLLLGESIGILGATQRKYLERIKLSTERFNRLIDDLVQTSMVESNPTRIEREEIDVCAVIQKAIKEANRTIQMKRVVLKTNLPDQPLKIISDQNALRRVIIPAAAKRRIGHTRRRRNGYRRSFGEQRKQDGLCAGTGQRSGRWDRPARYPQGIRATFKNAGIQGLGKNNVDFLRLKTLIEVLGGRTWVDSEPGLGATFSILLPAVPDQTDGKETKQTSEWLAPAYFWFFYGCAFECVIARKHTAFLCREWVCVALFRHGTQTITAVPAVAMASGMPHSENTTPGVQTDRHPTFTPNQVYSARGICRHNVQPGDTFSSLAHEYSTSEKAIMKASCIEYCWIIFHQAWWLDQWFMCLKSIRPALLRRLSAVRRMAG